MRIALLADAHGNLPALEAVLAHADARGCEAVWHLGDFVGYGPFPEETVQVLRETCDACIRGNYDRKVLRFPTKREKWRSSKQAEKFRAFEFAFGNLSPESLKFLRDLEVQRRLDIGGLRVLLVHGSPDSDSEPLDLTTPEQRLRELAASADADVICCGHSHVQFDRCVEGTRFVNPGAVGRPEGGDPRACYALLSIETGRLEVELLRVEYDVRRTVRALRQYDLPDGIVSMFTLGANLDIVREKLNSTVDDPAHLTSEPPNGCDDAARLTALADFADRLAGDRPHFEQVTRLALQLFDSLAPQHDLGEHARFLLHAAGLLHDVGWVEGQEAHHKTAAKLILETPALPLDESERRVIACIARYHRKAMPKHKHKLFRQLDAAAQRLVELLAGMLRVADGLDRTHRAVVQTLSCHSDSDGLRVRAIVDEDAGAEQFYAQRKADLLERALLRPVLIECLLREEASARPTP